MIWILLAVVFLPAAAAAQAPSWDDEPAGEHQAVTLRGPSRALEESRSGGLPPGAAGAKELPEPGESKASRPATAPLVTILTSLAVVLGLFAALVWVTRKTGRAAGGNRTIPDEAIRVLGQKSLGAAGTVMLLRCGRSVLVVGINGAGMHSLGHITDDDEVRALEATCLGESSASFRESLAEMQREPSAPGFLGAEVSPPPARKRLFAEA